jgi:hypothetical protein
VLGSGVLARQVIISTWREAGCDRPTEAADPGCRGCVLARVREHQGLRAANRP